MRNAVYVLASMLLCALATSVNADPQATAIELDATIALPVTVEKVWYRTDKVRLLGKAYEQSGEVTISDSAVEFTSKKGTITIPSESIRTVSFGKLSPDIMNEWVIVNYAGADGNEVAAFKAALFSGSGKENTIFSALQKIIDKKSAGP